MIARIHGTVLEVFDKGMVIDTGALGYMVYSPAVLPVGTTVMLHTHLIIRADAQELYGFQYSDERSLFINLISVSGVGPKTALQMLTMYPLLELVRAIRAGDAKAISLVPGIGKKTAEKVIIDLKDKLSGYGATEHQGSNDLVEALLSLGFKEPDIRLVLPTIDQALTLERQITTALQLLRK